MKTVWPDHIGLPYLFGSILFARVFGRLFGHQDITENSRDGNPGTANAFMQDG
ncbi:MAG: glycerol-3-phosphate acyltransferase [Lachnospiraceae bacterium]|nr:glycerol-3-phosphate acyltransferase [Lachnospiraceae bacterium]